MKATAIAPSNIAFVKYWGNADPQLNIPFNSSISMNLSAAQTRTTVEYDPAFTGDTLVIDDQPITGAAKARVSRHLDRIRALAHTDSYARVVSENNFPMGTGIASSAAAFAALSVAGTAALGVDLNQRQLTELARLGSGSAARSIPDGYVELKAGGGHTTAFAYTLYAPDYWGLRDIVVIVSREEKSVGSSEGHAAAETSPHFTPRLAELPARLKIVRQAIRNRDIEALGEAAEADAISLHVVTMTSRPPIYYWAPGTIRLIHAVQEWRHDGLPVYFTLDAGPNVHLICEAEHEADVLVRLADIDDVLETLVSQPAEGARLTDNHLF
ncbi:MAG: diphosphomevalonate decarboxylase [Anaerolineae bacterium]